MLYRDCPPTRTAFFASPPLARHSSVVGLGVLLGLMAGTACRGRSGARSTVDESAQPVLQAPKRSAVAPADLAALSPAIDGVSPLPLYADDPLHPWNRVHHALYVHSVSVSRTRCLANSASPDDLVHSTGCASRAVPLDPWPDAVMGPAAYEDAASLLALSDVRHLAEPTRMARLLALLNAASSRAAEKAQQPWPALLFQSDLWERYDALDASARVLVRDPAAGLVATDDQALRDRLLWLRDAVGRVLRDVALPAAQIRSLASNFPQLATRYPQLLPDFQGPSPDWIEIVTRSRSMPAHLPGVSFDYTRHASIAGFRSVFRRFARVPASAGGSGWLQRELSTEPAVVHMPVGTRLVILQQPLAVAADGQLVLWPRTDLIELRTVLAPAEPGLQASSPLRLADVPLDVLEGRRRLLRQAQPEGAGLQPLPGDAPFPMGGSCSPQPTVLAPLRAVCMTCHGRNGEVVRGAMTHGPQKTRILTDPSVPFAAVRDEKQRRPDFQALQRLF